MLEVEDGGVLAAMVDIALLSDVEDEGRTAVRLDYDSLMSHKYLLSVETYRKVANGECRYRAELSLSCWSRLPPLAHSGANQLDQLVNTLRVTPGCLKRSADTFSSER